MLADLITHLTPAQKSSLAEVGIGPERLSEWKKEKRLPTEVQVAYLSAVSGVSWIELQREVTLLRAPANQKWTIARAIGAVRNS